MTKKLVTVSAEASMRAAYDLMNEKGIRHLPVAAPGGEIVGIISDRDTQRAITPVKTPSGRVDEELASLDEFKVSDFMSWPLFAIPNDTSVTETVSIMIQRKISAVLVRDHAERVIGILTTEDLMRRLADLSSETGDSRKKIAEAFPGLSSGA